MRIGRRQLLKGQTSPFTVLNFLHPVYSSLHKLAKRPLSILDIGCGSGDIGMALKHGFPDIVGKIVGIDSNILAIEHVKKQGFYDHAICSSANLLPFQDKEFDIVQSIECLEHLYNHQVLDSMKEMLRVANYIIITTPSLDTVINKTWLNAEIEAAEKDPDPIDCEEFIRLEGAVHKSIVYPDSMIEAGFRPFPSTAQQYYAMSKEIDISKIRFVGIDQMLINKETTDFRQSYLQLLRRSLQLDKSIVK